MNDSPQNRATFIVQMLVKEGTQPDLKPQWFEVVVVCPLPTLTLDIESRGRAMLLRQHPNRRFDVLKTCLWRMRVEYTHDGLPNKTFAPEALRFNQRTGEVHTEPDTQLVRSDVARA